MKQISTTTIFIALAVIGVLVILLLASTGNTSKYDQLSLPLQIDEYFDYGCFHCQNLYPSMVEISNKFGSDVEVRHIYFNIFPESLPAAYAAEAAREQGKFEEYHRALFDAILEKRKSGTVDFATIDFVSIAQKLGLVLEKFNTDRASEQIQNRIVTNRAEAASRVTRGTPTIYIDGIYTELEAVNGNDFSPFVTKVEGIINTLKQK